jgi:two-component system, response regulator PdtaR
VNASMKNLVALVVEDNWLLRQEIVDGLQEAGWTVLEAATGGGALTVLRTGEHVDVLMTDIQLADAITGWEVAEAFRASHPRLPVIYTSGNPSNENRRVSGSAFLGKPLAISQLVRACSDLLARSS